MRRIYLGAKQAVIWLGEEGTAQTALELCRQIQEKKVSISQAAEYQALLGLCKDLFLHRPWRKRLWVIQEVIHDKLVMALTRTIQIDFDDLHTLFQEWLPVLYVIRMEQKDLWTHQITLITGIQASIGLIAASR